MASKIPFGSRLRLAGKALVGLFSEQSVTQAYSLLSGLYPTAQGAPLLRGTQALLEAYGTMPWLRAVTQKIAHSVASTQWTVWAPTNGKRDRIIQRAASPDRHGMIKAAAETGAFKQLESHPLLDALANANDFLVGPALLRTTQIHMDLVGEAFWIKERNGLGVPVGFWPIPSNWIQSTPTPRYRFYRAAFSGWRGDIPDTEILWIVDPAPANPYGRGTGIARTLADELETDEYAARHMRMTLLNRARPDLIIWPEASKTDSGVISDANAERLGERWRSEHQGFWRASLPFFATRKIGVHEVSQSFADLQLTELRKNERDIILQTFGMQPEMMGIVATGALTRAALESVEYIYLRNLVVPRVEFLRANLQERIVPEYDDRLVIDFVSPIAEDREFQLNAGKAAPWTMKVDEWRAMQGQEPLPDGAGQVFMVPSNVIIVRDIGEPTAPPAAASEARPPVKRAVASGASEYAEWQDALVACKDAGDVEQAVIVEQVLDENADDLVGVAKAVGKGELKFRRWMQAQLAMLQEQVAVKELDRKVRLVLGPMFSEAEVEVVAGVVPVEAWAASLDEPLRGFVGAAFLAGAQQGASDAGIPVTRDPIPGIAFMVVNEEAVAWALQHAGELITQLAASTRAGVLASVRATLETALRQGWDGYKTARMIRSTIGLTEQMSAAVISYANRLGAQEVALTDTVLFAKVGRYTEALRRARALTIARTELIRAGSEGQQKLWDLAVKAGQLRKDRMERVWVAAVDELTCPFCLALDHTTAPLGGTFKDGTRISPRHPRCRCTIGLRAKQVKQVAEPRVLVASLAAGCAGAPLSEAVQSGVSAGLAGVVADIEREVGR